MKFELLSNKHLSQLVAFEFENRAWFELFIESRGDAFYCQTLIEQHLLELTRLYHLGKHYPAVILIDGHITGRVNLKNICSISKTAEVGYRVAKNYVGSGVASFGLKQMLKLSKDKFALDCIKASVLDNNPASVRVLEKQGFVQTKKINNRYKFLGSHFSCAEYQLLVANN